MSLADVEPRTGLSKGFLSKVERDAASPSVANLVAICDAVGLAMSELFAIPRTTLIRHADRPSLDGLPKAHAVQRHADHARARAPRDRARDASSPTAARAATRSTRCRRECEVCFVLEGDDRGRARGRAPTRSAPVTRSPSAPPSRTPGAPTAAARILWILAPGLPDPRRRSHDPLLAPRGERTPRATPASARSPARRTSPTRTASTPRSSACRSTPRPRCAPARASGPRASATRRCCCGPATRRRTSTSSTCRIADLGDLDTTPGNAERTAAQIAEQLEPIIRAGVTPITLGGDHSIVLGELRAHAAVHGPLGVVLLDAHADTWEQYYGERYFHGTPFKRALEEGLIDPQRSLLAGHARLALRRRRPRRAARVGLRDRPLRRAAHLDAGRVRRAGARALGDGPAFLSFDIDVIDPAFAPATGTPEVCGLLPHEAIAFLRALQGHALHRLRPRRGRARLRHQRAD